MSVIAQTVLVVLAAIAATLPARADELDQEVLSAERTLRAAELRNTIDSTALSLYHEASRQAESALRRNPDSAGANFVYFAATGRILIADGATKNLFTLRTLDKQYLDKAIRLDPGYANALAAKGGVLLKLPRMLGGDSEVGLELLRRATKLNPGGPGTRLSFARALAEDGRRDEARDEARRAAHLSCIQGRFKSFEEASALLGELEAPVAKAGLN
jgi:tetratricopeptide (TPR) repeat protein